MKKKKIVFPDLTDLKLSLTIRPNIINILYISLYIKINQRMFTKKVHIYIK